jgi:hypothetical protein
LLATPKLVDSRTDGATFYRGVIEVDETSNLFCMLNRFMECFCFAEDLIDMLISRPRHMKMIEKGLLKPEFVFYLYFVVAIIIILVLD